MLRIECEILRIERVIKGVNRTTSMNRNKTIKIVLLLSACFNLLWIGFALKRSFCLYDDTMLSIKYGIPKSMVLSDWWLLYQKDPWMVYRSAEGTEYGSRFCLNYGEGCLMFYSIPLDDPAKAFGIKAKMVLAAPEYLLSWCYDTNGVCHDVKLRYNGREINCEDVMLD